MYSPDTLKNACLECLECQRVFCSTYSLKRHNGRKHKICEDIPSAKNSQYSAKNSQYSAKNSQYSAKNSHSVEHDSVTAENVVRHSCPLCYKSFSRNRYLIKHIENCKGEQNKLECEFCLKKFRNERSRFPHYKICCVKREMSVVVKYTESQRPLTTQHNSLVNGTQNITNNTNIIIVYNPTRNTPFSTDHLNAEDLQKILKLASTHIDNRVISEYSRQIFSNPENACIKKTNIKANHSHIHIGDNKWNLEIDKNIYPQLALDMANNMSDYLHTKRNQLKLAVFENLRNFVDCMADSGYINTTDIDREKELKHEYDIFVQALKLVVYGNTKT
jgi:hypothetical protein